MELRDGYAYDPPYPKNYATELLVIEEGDGVYLKDSAGRTYLDFGSGIAVNALGYGREDIAEIVSRQMKKLVHMSNLYATRPALELAEKIVAGGNFAAVHFGNSGTEANEAALKYARLYAYRKKGPEHHKLLAFKGAFHGRTMGALSCTPTAAYRDPFEPLVPGCEFAPFNDSKALEETLDGSFAAVIVEVVQGEGGLAVMTEDFAKALNTLCAKHDVILIADEVQTGLGRTGSFYASEGVGLSPDIITLAKPLAGGLPLSATLLSREDQLAAAAGRSRNDLRRRSGNDRRRKPYMGHCERKKFSFRGTTQRRSARQTFRRNYGQRPCSRSQRERAPQRARA